MVAQILVDVNNYTVLQLPKGVIYFSYTTAIGFKTATEQAVHVNDWSSTTGKHINAARESMKLDVPILDAVDFESALEKAFA